MSPAAILLAAVSLVPAMTGPLAAGRAREAATTRGTASSELETNTRSAA